MQHRLSRLAHTLLDLEMVVLVVAVAVTIALPQFLPAAIIVALLFWLLRLLAAKQVWISTPVDWALLPLLVSIPLSLWASADWNISQPHVYRLVLGILVLYSAIHWLHSADRARLLISLLGILGAGLAIVAPLLVGHYATQLSTPLSALTLRLPALLSDTVNPNVMAGALLLLFPLPLALLLLDMRGSHWLTRLLCFVSAGAMGVMLLLIASRGALLGLFVALLVLLCLRWRAFLWAIPPLLLVALIAILLLEPLTVLDILTGGDDTGGLIGRVEIWSRAIFIFQSFPFSGVGMGMFGPTADAVYPFFMAAPGEILHAHNLWLQVGVELGLPGVIGWLSAQLVVLVLAWRLGVGRPQVPGVRPQVWVAVGGGVLASMLGMLTHGLLDAPLWSARTASLMWLVWGVGIAGWLAATQRAEKKKPDPHSEERAATHLARRQAPRDSLIETAE